MIPDGLEGRLYRLKSKHPNRNTVAIRQAFRWHLQAAQTADGDHRSPAKVSPASTLLRPEYGYGNVRAESRFLRSELEKPELIAAIGAHKMDDTTALLKETTEEMRAAKAELESLANQVANLYSKTLPELDEHLKRFQGLRMAVAREMASTLTELRDVRRFFLESDHAEEVGRLERFAALCRELLELKKSGALDAICDSALRLEIGKEGS